MRRLAAVAVVLLGVVLGSPARAEVLIGMAGPLTGKDAWFGEQIQRGAAQAVADINAAGGLLGQQVRLIAADDSCDPEQAVAAANKLVSEGVIFVVGHYCSHASIPASAVYQSAGVLMLSPASTNPMLTELGRANVFRVLNRDDANGVVIGNYLADHWPGQKIAILHDNTTYGKGAAEEVRKNLNRRGLTAAIYQGYVRGRGRLSRRNRSAAGGGYRRGVHRRIPHRDRAHGPSGARSRLFGPAGRCQQHGD